MATSNRRRFLLEGSRYSTYSGGAHGSCSPQSKNNMKCLRKNGPQWRFGTAFCLVVLLAHRCFSWASSTRAGFAGVSPPRSSKRKPSVTQELERCVTPLQVLKQVGGKINAKTDPNGLLASLVLVRLSKQLVTLDNRFRQGLSGEPETIWRDELLEDMSIWRQLVETLSTGLADCSVNIENSLDGLVEGTKAAAIISRLLPELRDVWEPLPINWESQASRISTKLQPHQLSGLKWSYDCFRSQDSSSWVKFPQPFQDPLDELQLPFRIRPSCLHRIGDCLLVSSLVDQVKFRVDDIRAASNRVVKERRQTAWQGDDGVASFSYSGKSMETNPWSPLVRLVRDELCKEGGVYYDGCLINYYPDGGSAMRYHIDPDQGTIWDFDTAVVSLGATRRFAFRPTVAEEGTTRKGQPHTFTLMEGDVTEMFEDCQTRFQHTVKKAMDKNETVPRASLVFKKSFLNS